MIVGRLESEFGETKMLAKWRDDAAPKGSRIEADLGNLRRCWRAGNNIFGVVLNIGFIIDEEE